MFPQNHNKMWNVSYQEDPDDPYHRDPPICERCRVCPCRSYSPHLPIHREPIPTYEEAEALRILSLAKPLDPTKEQLEDLWQSTIYFIAGGPRWFLRLVHFRLLKRVVEMKPTDDATELDYKYRKSISFLTSAATSNADHRVIRAKIERQESCPCHRRKDCYCGKLKLREGEIAYFNWKAFMCEDRLEFY